MFRLMSIFVLLIFLVPVIAQETPEADGGWPVVERCVGEAIEPPADWTFEGTILTTGNYGIHGINAEWETPHVQVFSNRTIFGVLSPNGIWWASFTAQPSCPECFSHVWQISELNVVNTMDRSMTYTLPLNVYYDYGFSPQARIAFRWWSENEILFLTEGGFTYGWLDDTDVMRINPFTGEQIEVELAINPLTNEFDFIPSPDWSIAAYNEVALPDEPVWYLTDLYSGERLMNSPALTLYTYRNPQLVWSADSQMFVAVTEFEWDKADSIVLYDRDGSSLMTVYELPDNSVAMVSGWSFDGRYASFVLADDTDGFGKLMLIDVGAQEIIDTCATVSDAVQWSPTQLMLASLQQSSSVQNQPVQVIDILSNRVYNVAFHSGSLIGWREDPE